MAGTNEKLQIKKIGFGGAIKSYFSNLFNFKGRATRSEFWWVALVEAIVCTISLICCFALLNSNSDNTVLNRVIFGFITILLILVSLFSLGIGTRRLHDIEKSGLLAFVSGIANLVAIILFIVSVFIRVSEFSRIDVSKSDSISTISLIALLIGIVVTIILLIFALKPSSPTNKYGEPKIEQ